MLNSLVSRAAIKSRSRAVAVKRERNNLLNEVAELKRKLSEVEGERDALRELNAEMLVALNGYAWGIKTCGHNFVCICNQVKAEAIIAKIEVREINPWLRDSPAK